MQKRLTRALQVSGNNMQAKGASFKCLQAYLLALPQLPCTIRKLVYPEMHQREWGIIRLFDAKNMYLHTQQQ